MVANLHNLEIIMGELDSFQNPMRMKRLARVIILVDNFHCRFQATDEIRR